MAGSRKFLVLETKFSDDIRSLDHATCCRWLRDKSGLSQADLLKILDFKVNVKPNNCIMIQFSESADVEAISNRINGKKGKEMRGDLVTPVGLFKNLKICEVVRVGSGAYWAMVKLTGVGTKSGLYDSEEVLEYYKDLFKAEGVVVEVNSTYDGMETGLKSESLTMAVPEGSDWLRPRNGKMMRDGTIAVIEPII